MASNSDQTVERNPVEASQGSTKPKVIYVLGASLVLVLVAVVVAWMIST